MIKKNIYRFVTTAILCAGMVQFTFSAGTGTKKPISQHPSALKYDSLNWVVPLGKDYRIQLQNGLVAYIATDKQLPVVNITGLVHYGSLLDPSGKEGLSSLMSTLLRNGGTAKFPADTLDDLIDLFAMNFSFSSSESQLSFSVSFLSEYTNQAMEILQQIIYKPSFEPKRLERERIRLIEAIRHRFENPGPILKSAYSINMYKGEKPAVLATEKSVKSITRDDLIALHKKAYRTNNIILSASGDFNRDSMIARLEKLFVKDSIASKSDQFPSIGISNLTQCYFIHKPLTQAYVRIGFPLFKRPNDDFYPTTLLNEILGGGGFISRLGTTVRSDAGLTYSIYSVAESNYRYPATIYIDFFTKNESFSKAVELTLQEIKKITEQNVSADELNNAKSSLISELPSMFRSPGDIVSTYAWNEFYNRSETQYRDYPDKLKAITAEQVNTVAKKYLDISKMTYTVVGDTSALMHQKSDSFSLEKLKVKVTLPDSLPVQK
ncbi:MAG TPA: pitrilysin family protein [Chitinispirillaceae bacterium]|nr:pitrilysin family protein [Chitinispirillaceae bacterium]